MIIVNRRFMAFDSIILILQTLGPFTVLVTVYFLVTELKEQNKVARANARQNIADSHQKLALAGCLLYTSPSPRDVHLSRMPSSA